MCQWLYHLEVASISGKNIPYLFPFKCFPNKSRSYIFFQKHNEIKNIFDTIRHCALESLKISSEEYVMRQAEIIA
jgi:hypothetical protein